MPTAVVSAKGWIVVPAKLREKYCLRPGDRVQVVDYGGVLAIIPFMRDSVTEAAGMLKGATSLTQALLRERRKE